MLKQHAPLVILGVILLFAGVGIAVFAPGLVNPQCWSEDTFHYTVSGGYPGNPVQDRTTMENFYLCLQGGPSAERDFNVRLP